LGRCVVGANTRTHTHTHTHTYTYIHTHTHTHTHTCTHTHVCVYVWERRRERDLRSREALEPSTMCGYNPRTGSERLEALPSVTLTVQLHSNTVPVAGSQ